MRHAAWDALLSKPGEDGHPTRLSLEKAAKGRTPGAEAARARLVEPPFPGELRYLWGWLLELRAGVGEGMQGLAALTWETLDAWARRMRHDPEPHEIQALFSLDAVMRNPDAFKEG